MTSRSVALRAGGLACGLMTIGGASTGLVFARNLATAPWS
jgi:hypothetical protein